MEENYSNFPVSLIKDFMLNSVNVTYNLIAYECYKRTRDLDDHYDDDELRDMFKRFLNVHTAEPRQLFDRGEELYDREYGIAQPYAGVKIKMLQEFNRIRNKTNFDKIVFLAFLGLRSIIGKKTHAKSNMDLLFSRMAGNANSTDDLPNEIGKYRTEYYHKKIINELVANWGLSYYAKYTKGFYISFRLPLVELIKLSMKTKQSYKENLNRKLIKQAEEQALLELNNDLKRKSRP